MTKRGLGSSDRTAPKGQGATFIELFFDLVFVFSVTQIVGLFHHGITVGAVASSALVFWLIWWAWTQFTWALNASDTTHPIIDAAMLPATITAFVMTAAIPGSFGGNAIWFAISYAVLRNIGLVLYIWVVWRDARRRQSVHSFAIISWAGMLCVLIGAWLGGPWQYALWALAVVFDMVSAARAGKLEGWDVAHEHFAERHGLFVIIALGEAIIVAGRGLADGAWTVDQLRLPILCVANACALWWLYFRNVKPALEARLGQSAGMERSRLALDAYTLAHFFMLYGVILIAYIFEHATSHAHDPLHLTERIVLAAGLFLFAASVTMAHGRAGNSPSVVVAGLWGAVILALAVVDTGGSGGTLALMLVGLSVVIAAVSWRDRRGGGAETGEQHPRRAPQKTRPSS